MKTQLIAALLISSTLIAAPAFAGNNEADAPFTSFQSSNSGKTRAQVKAELAQAVQERSRTPEGNVVDPSVASIYRLAPAAQQTSLAQGNALADRAHP
jgi:hypothetical protein